jgi:hypothetical protein
MKPAPVKSSFPRPVTFRRYLSYVPAPRGRIEPAGSNHRLRRERSLNRIRDGEHGRWKWVEQRSGRDEDRCRRDEDRCRRDEDRCKRDEDRCRRDKERCKRDDRRRLS